MASKIVFLLAVVTLMYSKTTAQFFGGRQNLPFGGNSEQVGYKAGPAWGSLSQTHDQRGFSSPITVGAGADFYSQRGTGVGGGLLVQPGIGGLGNLRGQVGILDTPNHNINAFAQHDRYLDKNLRPFGPETNSLGVNYANKNGASGFLSGAQTHGSPARGTVGASIPIVNQGNTVVSVGGQTTFGHGMKPDSQVGVQVSSSF